MKNRDFTLSAYESLIASLKESAYQFYTFEEYMLSDGLSGKSIMLRHDVDAKHLNSLRFAEIQYKSGLKGSYYFRMIPESFNKETVMRIHEMGHEIGYHYETMDTSGGDTDKAYSEFCRNLETMRKLVPIKTICMHGSPMSKFDNRDLWKKYDYRKLGIVGEPYFDVDFSKIFYLTDTGRKWDGDKVSVRDKAMNSPGIMPAAATKQRYHTTFDIIHDLQKNIFPEKVMMNFHPQRWTNEKFDWYKELIIQSGKNQIKRLLVSIRNGS